MSYDNRNGKLSQYVFVIRELTGREIKRKYSRSKLGIVWSVLNPLLSMIVLSVVFTQMFSKSIQNFPIYYLCGNVLWSLFTTGTNTAMTSLVDNKQMLIKVKIPMQVFVLSRVYTAFINFIYSLIAFIPIIIFYKVKIHLCVLLLPVVVAFMLLFVLGMSYMLSIGYSFFGDLKHLYGIVLTLWMYLSAIFYPVDRLSGFAARVVNLNPVYNFIKCMRIIIYSGEVPSLINFATIAAWGVGMYLVGSFVFSRFKNSVMQKL